MGAVRPVTDPSVSPLVPVPSLKSGTLPKPGSLEKKELSGGHGAGSKICLHLILAWSVRMPLKEAGSLSWSTAADAAAELSWGIAPCILWPPGVGRCGDFLLCRAAGAVGCRTGLVELNFLLTFILPCSFLNCPWWRGVTDPTPLRCAPGVF